MQDYLRREGRAIAQPCFRILAWFDGSLNDPLNAAMAEAALVAFLNDQQDKAALIAIADKTRQPSPASPDDASIADAVNWLRTPDKVFAATLRLNGAPDVELGYPGVPHFRVDEDVGLVLLELSIPIDTVKNLALADALTKIVCTDALRCGVMGYGLYQPSRLSSLITFMPRAYNRYRCAIELQLTGPRDGIRRKNSAFDYAGNSHVSPGLADIGWRTLIGKPFLEEVSGSPELGIVQGGNNEPIVVSAGDAPIWGDVNAAEDISAYTAIAKWLKPLRYPTPVALNSLFGSQAGDPEGADRVEGYLSRFDQPDEPARFEKVEPFK